MSVALPALLLAAAAALASARSPTSGRLQAALPAVTHRPSPGDRPARVSPAAASCALGALALALLVGGPGGVCLGLAVGLLGPRALRRLEPRSVREERMQFAADLPLALDLLAACLAGGAPLPAAVSAVAVALPGPCGRRLTRVAAALDVGSRPEEAWSALLAAAGPTPAAPATSASRSPDAGEELAASAARALVRAAEGGAPVAAAIARLAEQAREVARASGQAAAERAGVLAVAPLGLCFLPAFVLLGVVPVVAGLVGPLLAGL